MSRAVARRFTPVRSKSWALWLVGISLNPAAGGTAPGPGVRRDLSSRAGRRGRAVLLAAVLPTPRLVRSGCGRRRACLWRSVVGLLPFLRWSTTARQFCLNLLCRFGHKTAAKNGIAVPGAAAVVKAWRRFTAKSATGSKKRRVRAAARSQNRQLAIIGLQRV